MARIARIPILWIVVVCGLSRVCSVDLRAEDRNKLSIRNDVDPPRSTPIPTGGKQPDPIYKVDPFYPPDARIKRIAGTVLLTVIVNEKGELYEASVIRGIPLLAQAALSAVRQWRYKPTGVPLIRTISVTLSPDSGKPKPSYRTNAEMSRL